MLITIVTHNEINNGVFSSDVNPESQVFWFHRHIVDLQDHLADPCIRNYLDFKNGALDKEAIDILRDLTERFKARMPAGNYKEYTLKWFPNKGVSPEDPEHTKYGAFIPFLIKKILSDHL